MTNLPTPHDLVGVAVSARRELLKAELRTTSRLASAFRQSELIIRKELDRVLDQIAILQEQGQPIGAGWIWSRTKFEQALALIETKIDAFAKLAAEVTETRQDHNVGEAIKDAEKTFRSFRSSGFGGFRLVNARSLEDLIGRFADGSPLSTYFSRYGEDTAQLIERQLVTGVLQGKRVRGIAKNLQTSALIPRNRAIVTARTEPLRSYRAATLRNYEANPGVIQGYIRLATLDRRTCPMCLALHGTFHKLSDPFRQHPACRCTMIPQVMGVDIDFGGDGETWFADQDEDVQEAILGPSKFNLYKDGMTLSDLIVPTQSEAFGPGMRERTLGELGDAPRVRRRVRSGSRETKKVYAEPSGATDTPPLPKAIYARRYLDSPLGTTVESFKEQIRTAEVEILGISADGKELEFAPVVGERSEVDLRGVGDRLKDRHVIHNHPRSGALSRADFAVAVDHDVQSLTAVLNLGGEIRIDRAAKGWPSRGKLLKAYRTGFDRAELKAVGKSRRKAMEIMVREIDRAFIAAFGADAPKIVLQ